MTKPRRQAWSWDRLDDLSKRPAPPHRAGLVIMLFIMGAFTVIVTFLFLVRGQAPFHANGTTYGATDLTYIVAGVTAGLFWVLLFRSRDGAGDYPTREDAEL